ncbi:hypothetical protein J2W34_000052 [Variovorax boronicumulans]|uniref:hypothetical protein n=1 Tax=Variovorax boronicumulans TaxID=436515 RepID=UPI0027803AB8|nr:hypothetical protein [Variovorax boronicumulans]MDQ0068278.1 hypothetical protein [Variovorax boronicumulans]
MPRDDVIQTNFTGGELSPQIALGRVDIAKYNNGARRIENCVITVQGGAKRRPGTRYIAPTKTQSAPSRLVEFVFNRGQAYMLEMGETYVRFMRNRVPIMSGGVPYEVSSPYAWTQLASVNYVQKADTAFFTHESVYPYRLQRFSDSQWSLLPVPFITEPFEEQGHYPGGTLTLSSGGLGAATATSVGAFLTSDVGRYISYGGGYALITGYTDANVVSLNIISPFANTVLPDGSWNLEGSPQEDLAPANVGREGQPISLNSNFTYFESDKALTGFIGGHGTAIITVAGHGYVIGDTVQILVGTTTITGVVIIVQSSSVFGIASPEAEGGLYLSGVARRMQISAGTEVFRAADVGSFVRINGGLVRITSVPSTSTANGIVLRAMTAAVPAGPNAWTLERSAWSALRGYPRAVTIHRQRLLFGGSPGYPQNIWASAIQQYLSFQFGTNDDDAFRFELDGPRNSPIRHLAPARQLLVLTEADEMSLKGGQEKPITPTNIQKTDESTTGASAVRPVKVGNEMLFVQAAGRKIPALGYRFDVDGFSSPDRTVFASHITEPGITQLAHQKEPDSTLYAVRTDGQMAVCAYDVEQEVTAWSRWITLGRYESVATVPTQTGEDAYVTVLRNLNGVERRYIEVFDPEMLVDCGITGKSADGQATWTGLAHLEGQTVQAWADGAFLGDFVVNTGAVTLPRPAKSVQIGLGFTCLIEMLQPGANAKGSQVHVNEVVLRVLGTSAAVINGTPQEFRRFGPGLLDQPPPSYSGDVRSLELSDEIFKTNLVITQPYPLPFHLLDVIRRVTVN